MRHLAMCVGTLIAASACALVGYDEYTPIDPVELYSTSGGPALRLSYRVTGRGNVHNPIDYSKRDYRDEDWIFLTQQEGATRYLLSHCPPGYKAKYGSPRNLEGRVEIESAEVRIALVYPASGTYSGKDAPFRFNGQRKLVRQSGPPPATINTNECESGAL